MSKSENVKVTEPRPLEFDNYFEWELTTEQKLAGAGALEHVLTDVPVPANSNEKIAYAKAKKEAFKIITSSLSQAKYLKYKNIIANNDPKALWLAIKADQGKVGKSSLLLANLRDQFHQLKYVPGTQTLQEYVSLLESFRVKLSGDKHPLDEDDIRTKLLSSLPKAGAWIPITMHLSDKALPLDETVQELNEYTTKWKEQLQPVGMNSANYAGGHRGRGRGRSRGRGGTFNGGRGRGRGRGRGGSGSGGYTRGGGNSGGNNREVGVRGGGVEKSGRGSSGLTQNQCRWCKGFGHWGNECTNKKDQHLVRGSGRGGRGGRGQK